jgi:hypothetical protein
VSKEECLQAHQVLSCYWLCEQCLVDLWTPIGLTLSPDPTTGHVYVQHIEAGMSAAESRLVLVSLCCCWLLWAAQCAMLILLWSAADDADVVDVLARCPLRLSRLNTPCNPSSSS